MKVDILDIKKGDFATLDLAAESDQDKETVCKLHEAGISALPGKCDTRIRIVVRVGSGPIDPHTD